MAEEFLTVEWNMLVILIPFNTEPVTKGQAPPHLSTIRKGPLNSINSLQGGYLHQNKYLK